MYVKKTMWSAMAAMVLASAAGLAAQTPAVPAPAAPTPQPGTGQVTFPKVDPKNFTATSPTADEVNSFLKAMWGYDESRMWEVAAILKTPAPGVSKVVVFVGDKTQADKGTTSVFYTTPDGKHAIADKVMVFGAKPFADTRTLLQARADGPVQGAKGNELMLVVFADMHCSTQCKDVRDTLSNLATDFPEAKIVYENFPQTDTSAVAAVEGLCVRKEKGDAAFFTYIQSLFAKQDGLTKEAEYATLSAAATAAGADPKAAAACAATAAAKEDVAAQVKLGKEIGIDQAPTLIVNGYALPMLSLPYNILRRIVAYRAGQDGIEVHLQPMLSTLK